MEGRVGRAGVDPASPEAWEQPSPGQRGLARVLSGLVCAQASHFRLTRCPPAVPLGAQSSPAAGGAGGAEEAP